MNSKPNGQLILDVHCSAHLGCTAQLRGSLGSEHRVAVLPSNTNKYWPAHWFRFEINNVLASGGSPLTGKFRENNPSTSKWGLSNNNYRYLRRLS